MHKTLCVAFLLGGTLALVGRQSVASPAAPSFTQIIAKVSHTNQSGNIPPTTIVTIPQTGLYRYSAYIATTNPTSAGGQDWGLNFGWSDDAGAEQAQVVIAATSTSTPPNAYGQSPDGTLSNVTCFRALAGTPVTYWVDGDVGLGGAYEVFITIERLQ